MDARYMTAVIIALLALSDVGHAELRGTPEGPQAFTAAEDRIIERNEALGSVVRSDPWLARQVLDALAALDGRSEALERASIDLSESPPQTDNPPQAIEADDPNGAIDLNDNPDLRRLERASPEALHDLFQVLKQAGSGQQQAK